MSNASSNVYDDAARARAYAELEFPGTYHLAFRDLPALIGKHASGGRALDFGCGTGRSTRFLRSLGFAVVGVDISAPMLAEAHRRDPAGDYRLVDSRNLCRIAGHGFDVALAAFTFDNIPTDDAKLAALAALRGTLAVGGRLLMIVSTPEIYVHEWASFSTRDFPANRHARDGDHVEIVMLDVADRRPVEDVVCSDAHYRELLADAGLAVLEHARPLASGEEAIQWRSELTIPPWSVYVLGEVNGAA